MKYFGRQMVKILVWKYINYDLECSKEVFYKMFHFGEDYGFISTDMEHDHRTCAQNLFMLLREMENNLKGS